MMKVKLYTDGAAKNNPHGPGGYAAILIWDIDGRRKEKEIFGGFRRTTNNRMELMAAIAGLEALDTPSEVEIYSDAQYMVQAFNDRWIDKWVIRGWKREKEKPLINADLWKRLYAATKKHSVQFFWVRGHAGNPLNERCDKLATSVTDRWDLPPDEEYENPKEEVPEFVQLTLPLG